MAGIPERNHQRRKLRRLFEIPVGTCTEVHDALKRRACRRNRSHARSQRDWELRCDQNGGCEAGKNRESRQSDVGDVIQSTGAERNVAILLELCQQVRPARCLLRHASPRGESTSDSVAILTHLCTPGGDRLPRTCRHPVLAFPYAFCRLRPCLPCFRAPSAAARRAAPRLRNHQRLHAGDEALQQPGPAHRGVRAGAAVRYARTQHRRGGTFARRQADRVDGRRHSRPRRS